MAMITCTATVAADAATLFALSQDYGRRLEWDPYLREARLLGGATAAGLGVRAWCVTRGGLGMETVYVSFRPPHVAAVKMTRGPAILARFAGAWRFVALAPGQTQVIFRYSLAARPAALRPLLDPPLARLFRRDMERRIDRLGRAAAGEPLPAPV